MTFHPPPITELFAKQRRFRFRRWAGLVGGSILLLGGGAFLSVVHLATGEISADWVRDKLAEKLTPALGQGARLDLKSAVIDREGGTTRLVLSEFAAYAADGRRILGAPQAVVTFNPLTAAIGRFAPQRIELVGLDVRVRFGADGAFDVSAEQSAQPDAPEGAPQPEEVGSLGHSDIAVLTQGLSGRLAAAINLAMSDEGRFAAFEQFGLRHGRLVVQDPERGRSFVLSDIDAEICRDADGSRRVSLAGAGRRGPWRVDAHVGRNADGRRRLAIDAHGFAAADLAAAARLDLPFGEGATLAATLRAEIDAAGAMGSLGGTFAIAGLTTPQLGQYAPPVKIDRIAGALAFDPATRAIEVTRLEVEAGRSRLEFAGQLTIDDAGRVVGSITKGFGQFDEAANHLQPVRLDEAAARFVLDESVFALESFAASGPEFKLQARAKLERAGDEGRFDLDLTGSAASASAAFRLWPTITAGPVRHFMLTRGRGGSLENIDVAMRMPLSSIAAAIRDEGVPDETVRVVFKIKDVSVALIDGLPPLDIDELDGVATGRTATLTLQGGGLQTRSGQKMVLKEGRVVIGDPALRPPQPAPIDASFRLSGAASGLADLLAAPAVAAFVGRDVPMAMSKGRVDLKLHIGMPLQQVLKPGELRLEGAGTLSDITIEKALAGEAIQAANFALKIDRTMMALKGDATFQGAPATIDLKKAMRGGLGGEVSVALRLDDGLRARRGMQNPGVAGPMTATIKALLGGKETQPRVELDLTRTAISGGLVPGWSKAAGRPGKASFVLVSKPGGYELSEFSADASGLQLQGAVSLDSTYGLRSARFDKFRLSPGDVGKLEVEKTGAGWKATIRASVLDARPFLGNFLGGQAGARDDGSGAGALELDIKSDIVTGHHAEALSNVDLKLLRAGPETKTFRLSGRFGAASVSGNLARRDDGATVLVLQSQNAGAALRFADLYRRMQGGSLLMQSSLAGAQQEGILVIRSFALKDEPAMKRVLAEPGLAKTDHDRPDLQAGAARLPGDGMVRFDRLRAEFKRGGGRLELSDAVMWGPTLGASIEGWIDFGRNAIAMTGTFVPAYALNNIFAKVPVLGFFLGGGEHGGLFAVNFKLSGSASQPQLTVNPLSAVAPGFLRKFFEFSRANNVDLPPARIVDPGSQR